MPSVDTSFLSGLSPSKVRILEEAAAALRMSVDATVLDGSDICKPEFVEEFQNRLVMFHSMNDEPLSKKTFEFTFVHACRAAGSKAVLNQSSTHSGADVIVDGVRFSLKTEAAKSIKRNKLTISKLMEARWIRECRVGKDFCDRVVKRVVGHLEEYERILSLRAFRDMPNFVEYQLVEIPKSILLLVKNLKAEDYDRRTENGSSGADVVREGSTIYRLTLDGSVEKVTVNGLTTTVCPVHAKWVIPFQRKLV